MRRHNSGILAISVLSTNMAVLGRDNRLSLWVLGMVNTQHQAQHFALLASAAHETEGLVSLLVSQSHICDVENQSRLHFRQIESININCNFHSKQCTS